MKKLITSIAVMVMAAISMPMSAQETVKTLFTGEHNVTWGTTLSIGASEFAEGVNVGHYIYIQFNNAKDGALEIKANGECLPGSLKTILGTTSTDYKAYITSDMLEQLKQYGVEICGESFNVTSVSICNDGFNMPQGAIWGGYFWVENWNTLELFKTAFDNYKGQRFMDIYFSDELGDFTGYFVKVLTQWANDTEGIPEVVWAGNNQIVHSVKMATVDLGNVEVAGTLESATTLYVQANPEGGNAFNITAIVLRDDVESGISDVKAQQPAVADIYNLQGSLVMRGVTIEQAKTALQKGLYITRGQKFIVK